MITKNHSVVVVVSAHAALTVLDKACEGYAIRNLDFFKLVVIEIALEQWGLAYVRRQRKTQLNDQAIGLATRIAESISRYLWHVLSNVIPQWCVVDDIKIIGVWEIWLCLNPK